MSGYDAEIETFKRDVSCAALLERLPPPWKLDKAESTRSSLKYRRNESEVLIVNHDGRGWWDPMSQAKGDVFKLVQHLDPSMSFGQVRKVLRPFVGLSPTYPEALRNKTRAIDDRPIADRWASKPRISKGCPAWDYLTVERRLPIEILEAARAGDTIRQGAYGSAWFAHRDAAGAVSHIEIRGADFKGSVRGGSKTLFRLDGSAGVRRMAVAEAPIDALSLAAIEGIREDTAYAATGGGMGPGTVQAIQRGLALIGGGGLLVSATDANRAGERYAERHAEIAAAAGVLFERMRPLIGEDWNDTLKGRGV